MKVTTERLPESQMLLNIEIEEAELEAHKDRAYRRLVQRAVVPGFRKGKAPRRVLERFLGPETLLQEAMDTLLPETAARAIEEENLDAVAEPTIELGGTEPVTFKATVPLKPTGELGDYHSIRLPWEEPAATEEQVEAALERIRTETTPWAPAERAIQMGDMVTLDVRGTVTGPLRTEPTGEAEAETGGEGQEPQDPDQPQERVFLQEEAWTYHPRPESTFPAPGFADQIVGMERGETREFTIIPPNDYSVADLAGRECRFVVTLKEVKEQDLPEMDDEWAKGVGEGHDSVADLREKIREDLQTRLEIEAGQRYENQALERLVEETTIEYPPAFVEHEIQHLLEERQQRLSSLGIDLGQYLSMTSQTPEELLEEVRPEAQRRVVNTLVLDWLAQAESLEATEEDLQREMDRFVGEDASEERRSEAQRLFAAPETQVSLRRSIVTRKAMERLVEIARGEAEGEAVTEAEATGEAAAEEPAEPDANTQEERETP